ncbi:hypothetical protein H6P81_002612 [Aristolochia fimbriata]|uniref:Nodulation signaling pathway 1-like protein n=1 Tax=Aristolochia fimbriata TaxID=158543 RepID=A0AAV7FBX6_ARIFI|nr:hypothetical protein H6P81_002612 [Aristolochia fimbriata]
MTIEEVEQTNPTSDHLLDWLNDSISIVPSILDDPYACQWWEPDRDPADDLGLLSEVVSRPTISEIAAAGRAGSGHGHSSNISPSKKRKPNPNSASIDQRRKIIISHGDDREDRRVSRRTTQNGKKPPGAKNNGGNNGNGSNKEARWAEQLLNPCAEAIAAGNASRVQHYLCVLQELASVSGDANYRLAAHGLRALTRHVSAPSGGATPPFPASVFASTDPKVFHDSLIRFNEISPWFSFPNAVANASIVQMLSSEGYMGRGTLRIIDIGVSHGVQWPTLLEALTRRPGGPPSLVRLTVVVPPAESQSPAVPFSLGPPGDDFPSRLLRFAKRIDLNLQIETLEAGLEALLQAPKREEEILVVCAQFRLHELGHGGHHGGQGKRDEDERGEFLRRVRGLGPDLVVVSEEEGDECGCSRCGGFAVGFSRRVGVLWRFLDSTSAAFKGRECVERRVMEGEAATALGGANDMMKEGRRGWCDRLRRAGFVAEAFGEDAVDGGRALLKKYDGNWEMKMDEEESVGGVCLCWKGQPVSFCSLWKLPDPNAAGES